jgi:hypothetical protein
VTSAVIAGLIGLVAGANGLSYLEAEPIRARRVEDPDGECPKPPSPRFPVWKPRYLDGGVFPFKNDR